MKAKIRLDTIGDVNKFVSITSKLKGRIVIKDSNSLCVNAKSLLGALHAMEFNELWCESEEDIWLDIQKFIVIE
jgi:hypothetical protein